LGRSLGLDIVPFKTCTYDCIYCQLGRTTRQTIAREEYVGISDILDQLWKKLAQNVQPDYITVSGSGEPTLNSAVGELIASIKGRTSIPVAVLTNGSLLWQESVRKAVSEADVVLPSLDAGDPQVFREVNRPHPELAFETVVQGLRDFRKIYQGQIWLEVLLVDGVNSESSHLERIKRLVKPICPDRIQINTVVRPPAEAIAKPVSPSVLSDVKGMFGDLAEVIAAHEVSHSMQTAMPMADEIEALLKRRPCTLEDIVSGLQANRSEAAKHLGLLEEKGAVQRSWQGDRTYYQLLQIG
jgi:wyosine [tRNA(Phe)-imidazoG37] synthetase (radical SAM superfamily)